MEASLPVEIEQSAFQLCAEYAWQKQDLAPVFAFCRERSWAILGGEAWVVLRLSECDPEGPTEPRHNLVPTMVEQGHVLSRTREHVILGSFPLLSGEHVLLSWSSSEYHLQPWAQYVEQCIQETATVVEQAALETSVVAKYAPYVYYNLVFATEERYSELEAS